MEEGRKLRMEDIMDVPNCKNKNKSNTHSNTNDVPKNQNEFGHRKRIKP